MFGFLQGKNDIPISTIKTDRASSVRRIKHLTIGLLSLIGFSILIFLIVKLVTYMGIRKYLNSTIHSSASSTEKINHFNLADLAEQWNEHPGLTSWALKFDNSEKKIILRELKKVSSFQWESNDIWYYDIKTFPKYVEQMEKIMHFATFYIKKLNERKILFEEKFYGSTIFKNYILQLNYSQEAVLEFKGRIQKKGTIVKNIDSKDISSFYWAEGTFFVTIEDQEVEKTNTTQNTQVLAANTNKIDLPSIDEESKESNSPLLRSSAENQTVAIETANQNLTRTASFSNKLQTLSETSINTERHDASTKENQQNQSEIATKENQQKADDNPVEDSVPEKKRIVEQIITITIGKKVSKYKVEINNAVLILFEVLSRNIRIIIENAKKDHMQVLLFEGFNKTNECFNKTNECFNKTNEYFKQNIDQLGEFVGTEIMRLSNEFKENKEDEDNSQYFQENISNTERNPKVQKKVRKLLSKMSKNKTEDQGKNETEEQNLSPKNTSKTEEESPKEGDNEEEKSKESRNEDNLSQAEKNQLIPEKIEIMQLLQSLHNKVDVISNKHKSIEDRLALSQNVLKDQEYKSAYQLKPVSNYLSKGKKRKTSTSDLSDFSKSSNSPISTTPKNINTQSAGKGGQKNVITSKPELTTPTKEEQQEQQPNFIGSQSKLKQPPTKKAEKK